MIPSGGKTTILYMCKSNNYEVKAKIIKFFNSPSWVPGSLWKEKDPMYSELMFQLSEGNIPKQRRHNTTCYQNVKSACDCKVLDPVMFSSPLTSPSRCLICFCILYTSLLLFVSLFLLWEASQKAPHRDLTLFYVKHRVWPQELANRDEVGCNAIEK